MVLMNEELEGDVFPGSCSIKEFTNTSHINVGGRLFNQNDDGTFYLNKPVTNIKEYDGLISFDFMGGIYVPKPYSVSAETTESDAFTLNWNIDGEIDSFEIEVVEVRKKTPFESVIVSENFANLLTEPSTDDGKMDLSTYLNSYTQTNGWSGKRIYTSSLGAKIGTSTDSGHIMTPFLNSNTNNITIKLSVQCQEGENVPINVVLINERNDTINLYAIDYSTEKGSYIFTFGGLDDGYYAVNLQSNQPFYLSSFTMYDGAFTEDDLKITSIIGVFSPAEKYLVSGVTDKTYKFSGLKANEFQYRIRATKDEAYSEWTEYGIIKLDGSSGIVNSFYDDMFNVKIYNLNGVVVKDTHKAGAYIIDYGTYKKKIIKRND